MTPEAFRSGPDVAIQGTRTRKRSWSSTKKSTTCLDAGVPAKQSRRTTKETWKAREAREARETAEAKHSRTSSSPYRKNKARSVCLNSPVSDVGKVADVEDVYLVTLSWMVEQLRRHLSFELSLNTLMVWDRFQLIRPEITTLLKNNNSHWLTKEVNARLAKEPKTDPWNDGNKTRSLNIAADILKGWATGPIVDSFEGEMKDAGTLTRTPGNYRDRSPGQSKAFRLGATNEQIHPTVAYRMDKLGSRYRPEALAGFNRQVKKDNNGKVSYEWVKDNIRIPEYKIGPDLSNQNFVPGIDEKTGLLRRDDTLDQWPCRQGVWSRFMGGEILGPAIQARSRGA